MKKSILDLAAEGIYRELHLAEGDLSKLPEVTRPIALLYMFQGMVDNGGFRYPMENDFARNPPYAQFVEAYRCIGAIGAAEALDQAGALFPTDHPECDAAARNAYFDSLGEGKEWESSEFNQLSDRVCGDDTIWKQMDDYVEKHRNDFAPYITQ